MPRQFFPPGLPTTGKYGQVNSKLLYVNICPNLRVYPGAGFVVRHSRFWQCLRPCPDRSHKCSRAELLTDHRGAINCAGFSVVFRFATHRGRRRSCAPLSCCCPMVRAALSNGRAIQSPSAFSPAAAWSQRCGRPTPQDPGNIGDRWPDSGRIAARSELPVQRGVFWFFWSPVPFNRG